MRASQRSLRRRVEATLYQQLVDVVRNLTRSDERSRRRSRRLRPQRLSFQCPRTLRDVVSRLRRSVAGLGIRRRKVPSRRARARRIERQRRISPMRAGIRASPTRSVPPSSLPTCSATYRTIACRVLRTSRCRLRAAPPARPISTVRSDRSWISSRTRRIGARRRSSSSATARRLVERPRSSVAQLRARRLSAGAPRVRRKGARRHGERSENRRGDLRAPPLALSDLLASDMSSYFTDAPQPEPYTAR